MSISTQETTEVNIEVGDKAIFLGYRGTGEPCDMLEAGDILTVTEADEEDKYAYSVKRDSDGAETNLLIASELRVLKPKFKVGDRIIGTDRAPHREQRGALGTVTEVNFWRYPVAEGFLDSWGSFYVEVDWDNADDEGRPYPSIGEGFVDAAPVEVERTFQIGEPVYVSGRLGRIVSKNCIVGITSYYEEQDDHFMVEFADGENDCFFTEDMAHAVNVGDTVDVKIGSWPGITNEVESVTAGPVFPVQVGGGVFTWREVSVHVEPEPEPAFKVGDRVLWTDGITPSSCEGVVIAHEGGDRFKVDWGVFGKITYSAKFLLLIEEPKPAFSEGDLVTVSEGAFFRDEGGKEYLYDFSGPGKVLYGPDSDGDYQVELLNGDIQHVSGECLSIRIVTEAEPTFVPGDRVVGNDTYAFRIGSDGSWQTYVTPRKGRTGVIVAEKYGHTLGERGNMLVEWDGNRDSWDIIHHSCLDLIEPEAEVPSLAGDGELELKGRYETLLVQQDRIRYGGGIYILPNSDDDSIGDWYDRDATKLLHATLGKYLAETEEAAA